MANVIGMTNNNNNADDSFIMSNGATSVFISVLVISGSRIARTDREKELITWIACRDQTFRGGGTVGFSICDMPWSYNGFEQEKQFMLYVIMGALQKVGWDLLEYTPNEEFAFMFLDKFYCLISKFEKELISKDGQEKWNKIFNESEYYLPANYHKCKKHNVFLHWYGCVICNDNAGKVVSIDEKDIE